jgi:hypothetical protein
MLQLNRREKLLFVWPLLIFVGVGVSLLNFPASLSLDRIQNADELPGVEEWRKNDGYSLFYIIANFHTRSPRYKWRQFFGPKPLPHTGVLRGNVIDEQGRKYGLAEISTYSSTKDFIPTAPNDNGDGKLSCPIDIITGKIPKSRGKLRFEGSLSIVGAKSPLLLSFVVRS